MRVSMKLKRRMKRSGNFFIACIFITYIRIGFIVGRIIVAGTGR